ncbi:MAG: hypothetical protein J6S21_01415 [Victivallales bacterium]|nr:hypothetical protein [Victivallales bacterium]
MKSLFFAAALCAVLFISLPCSGATVFSADFENGTAGTLVDGTQLQAVQGGDFAQRKQSGVKGSGCLVSPAMPLMYPAKGLVNPLKGSVSFWIKPLDWEAGDKDFRPVFWLGGDGAHSVLYYLLLTGNSGMPQASFFTRLTGKELVAQHDFKREVNFGRNKWTFVVVNWNAWQIEFFLNGKLCATLSYSLPVESYNLQQNFRLWFGNSDFWGKKLNYSSVIDEIRVYDDILTPGTVESEYLANTAKVQHSATPHRVTVPLDAASSAIALDGVRGDEEWHDAAVIPLNKDFFRAQLLPEKSFLSLKHDNQHLYFLFVTDSFSKNPVEGIPERSTEAFAHDVFEFILRPAAAAVHTEPYSQFAISPQGCWAAHHNKDWDAATSLQYEVGYADGMTCIEGRLALREIAPDFRTGQSFQAAFGYTLNDRVGLSSQERIRGWSHVKSVSGDADYSVMYHYPQAMGEVIFANDASFSQINALGSILYGAPAIQLKNSAGQTMDVVIRSQKDTPLDRKVQPGPAGETVSAMISSPLPLICSVSQGKSENPDFFYEASFSIRDPLQVSYEVFARDSQIVFALDASGISKDDQEVLKSRGLPGRIVLVSKEAPEKAIAAADFRMNAVKQNEKFAVPELAKGEYTLRLAMQLPGSTIEKSLPLEVPEQDFLLNTRGYERKVFPPWTDIRVGSDREISMIGREYRFNALGMPEKISAWGEDVLAAPVEFKISRGGSRIIFRPSGRVQLLEEMPDRVIHTGKALSADGTLILQWHRTCEFDGMVLYRLEVRSAKEGRPLKLDKVEISFQVTPNSSRYLMAPGHIADWDGKHAVDMPFMAFYWLSGIRTGLDFFLPDNGNWRIAAGGRPISFRRSGASAPARVTAAILSEQVSISKPLTYTFGFLATPARPLNKKWRAEHVAGWGTTDCQTVQDYWAYNDKVQQLLFPNKCLLSEVVSEEGAHAEVAMWHKRNTRVVPYSLHTCMPDNNRFYDFFGTEWRSTTNGIPNGKSFRSKFLGKEFYMCSPVCPTSTYSRFLNWCVGNLMLKYDFDGVYLDGSQASKCDNRMHGCGYTDAFGREITPYNDLGCRESFRALQQTIHGIKPEDGVLYCHANILNAPHVHSMCDIMLPGEELMPAIVGRPKMYTDNLPLERWQSSYNLAKLLLVYHIH